MPLILLYHRVAAVGFDPFDLCVTPSHFEEHLQVLGEGAAVLRLCEFVERLGRGTLPVNAVAITFDDGYADNALIAAPLLARYATPATFFVATGALDDGSEFWWDELHRLVIQAAHLPLSVQVSIGGAALELSFGADAAPGADSHSGTDHWRIGASPPTGRHNAYRVLWRHFRELTDADRRAGILTLRRAFSATSLPRPTHRVLSHDELTLLAQDDLFEVAAHSITHSVLTTLSADQQNIEIAGSKARIEELTGKRVTSFSYPFGGPSDFDDRCVEMVREAGYTCACAATPGSIQMSRIWALPRVLVPDIDGESFKRTLAQLRADETTGSG